MQNSFGGPQESARTRQLQPQERATGDIHRISSGELEDNFAQASIFYNNVLNADEQARLASNIAGHLADAADFLQERAVKNFSQVSAELGGRIAETLKLKKSANL